jgi:hypothetical protein
LAASSFRSSLLASIYCGWCTSFESAIAGLQAFLVRPTVALHARCFRNTDVTSARCPARCEARVYCAVSVTGVRALLFSGGSDQSKFVRLVLVALLLAVEIKLELRPAIMFD